MAKSENRLLKEREFLDKNVFHDLDNLNNGFDARGIKYFSEDEFRIVLDRVKKLGLGIFGIEPWRNGEYYWVKTYEEYTSDPTDPAWYMKAFEEFKNDGEPLKYAASYFIPDKYLDPFPLSGII